MLNPSHLLQIERLVLENGKLKQSKIELEDKVSRQEKELTCANSEINKLQSSLFNSMSEVDVLRGKVTLDWNMNHIGIVMISIVTTLQNKRSSFILKIG